MNSTLRRPPLPAALLVVLALGAGLAPAASAATAGGDQSPSYTGTGSGGRGALRLRITILGHPRAHTLARSGRLRVRVSSNVGAFVVLRSAIRGAGGRRVRAGSSPKPVGLSFLRAGSHTTVIKLPHRLRVSLRSATRVSISLRATGQSSFGALGRATLSRRFGR